MPATPAPATAAGACAGAPAPLRLRRRLARALLFMTALCTAIAALLSAFGGRPGVHLVYSFAIGFSCWALIDGTRLLIDAAAARWQRRRGLPAPADTVVGWGTMLPLIALGVLLGPVVGMAIGDGLLGGRSPPLWAQGSGSRVTLVITLLGTLVAVATLSTLEHLASARARAEAAQRAAAEAQLRLLQSQLEPHMLFNTLANLRVLIAVDAARAQTMLDRLIAYLRATLAASRAGRHTLAEEFARIDDYLALMAVRMGARLQPRLELPAPLRTREVPALLLQPLVENVRISVHRDRPFRDRDRRIRHRDRSFR
jgi:MFS family permease